MIRAARKTDIPALVALEATCFDPAHFPISKGEFREIIGQPNLLSLVWCDKAGVICGHIYGEFLPRRKAFSIDSIAVYQHYRSQGIGRALLREAIRQARERHFRISLEAAADDSHVINFYKTEGFAIIDRKEDFYEDSSACVVMVHEVSHAL